MLPVEPGPRPPLLRRLWDYVPSPIRRWVVQLLGNSRLRLRLLDLLRIRPAEGFISLNRGLGALDEAMQRLNPDGPKGDYYEFGLYRGYSFWYAQQSADRHGITDMRFYGFDSFEGLPDVKGDDKDRGIFFSGDYACMRQEVESQLTAHGFDWSRGVLVEGFFDHSLTSQTKASHRMGPAALVLIDCDLYQSTVPVLHFLTNLLQDGTIIMFDDWYCFGRDEDSGEPRAFREFLAEHPEWVAHEWIEFPAYGKGFVMRHVDAGV